MQTSHQYGNYHGSYFQFEESEFSSEELFLDDYSSVGICVWQTISSIFPFVFKSLAASFFKLIVLAFIGIFILVFLILMRSAQKVKFKYLGDKEVCRLGDICEWIWGIRDKTNSLVQLLDKAKGEQVNAFLILSPLYPPKYLDLTFWSDPL